MSVAVVVLTTLLSCSSTYRSMSVEEKRTYLAELESDTLAELLRERPEAQTDLDTAVGYAIISNARTKIPFVGAGEGIGVVVDRRSGERAYLKVGRIEVGGGLGVRRYRLVILFLEEEPLKKLASGKLEVSVGLEAGAGEGDLGSGQRPASSQKKGFVTYQLSEAGVSATFTVRLSRYSVLDLGE